MKLSGMIKEYWFHNPEKFHIDVSFQIDFMSHQIWKIGCVNYVRFPKSINKFFDDDSSELWTHIQHIVNGYLQH